MKKYCYNHLKNDDICVKHVLLIMDIEKSVNVVNDFKNSVLIFIEYL